MGLGNPGERYRDTRHNAGFRVIDLWCGDMGLVLHKRLFRSRSTRTRFRGKDMVLLCPQTFMNLSGEAVRACADYYAVDFSRILVVHDDLDIPLGRIKVTMNRGAGGHRGVSSVIRHLGTGNFSRVKVGIGRPRYGESVEDYVLSPFYADEKGLAERAIRMAVKACELSVLEGVESAMNKINCQKLTNKEENN